MSLGSFGVVTWQLGNPSRTHRVIASSLLFFCSSKLATICSASVTLLRLITGISVSSGGYSVVTPPWAVGPKNAGLQVYFLQCKRLFHFSKRPDVLCGPPTLPPVLGQLRPCPAAMHRSEGFNLIHQVPNLRMCGEYLHATIRRWQRPLSVAFTERISTTNLVTSIRLCDCNNATLNCVDFKFITYSGILLVAYESNSYGLC
jgi:hypothetical protein